MGKGRMEAATRAYQETSAQQRQEKLIVDHLEFANRIYGSLAVNLPAAVDEENLFAEEKNLHIRVKKSLAAATE